MHPKLGKTHASVSNDSLEQEDTKMVVTHHRTVVSHCRTVLKYTQNEKEDLSVP